MSFNEPADANWSDDGDGSWRWKPKAPDSDPEHPNHSVYLLRRMLRLTALANSGEAPFICTHSEVYLSRHERHGMSRFEIYIEFADRNFFAEGPSIDEAVERVAEEVGRAVPAFKKEIKAETRRARRGQSRRDLFIGDGPDCMW